MVITIGVLAPALKVAGIAIASEFIGRIMEEHGHGNKVMFVRVVAYVACGAVALDCWWDGVRRIAHAFGVSL